VGDDDAVVALAPLGDREIGPCCCGQASRTSVARRMDRGDISLPPWNNGRVREQGRAGVHQRVGHGYRTGLIGSSETLLHGPQILEVFNPGFGEDTSRLLRLHA